MPYKRVLISIFLSMIFLFPLYMILVNSFKFDLDIIKNPAALPDIFTLKNYLNIFSRSDQLFTKSLLNSILFTSLSIFIVLILSSTLAFSMYFLSNRIQNIIFIFLLLGLILLWQQIL